VGTAAKRRVTGSATVKLGLPIGYLPYCAFDFHSGLATKGGTQKVEHSTLKIHFAVATKEALSGARASAGLRQIPNFEYLLELAEVALCTSSHDVWTAETL